MRVLLVDDHEEMHQLVSRALERDGSAVVMAASLGDARERLQDGPYDVIVLDLGLGDGSGLQWCEDLRRQRDSTPVLVLTAQTAVDTRVRALDLGADDFLGKPFALAELKARLRALSRRRGALAELRWERDPVSLDFPRRRALVSGAEVPLTAREWGILEVLMLGHGRVVARARVIDEAWGGAASTESSLEVLVTRIRKKLGSDVITTVRGEGYRLG